jgi:hypothetical protein
MFAVEIYAPIRRFAFVEGRTGGDGLKIHLQATALASFNIPTLIDILAIEQ